MFELYVNFDAIRDRVSEFLFDTAEALSSVADDVIDAAEEVFTRPGE